MNFRLPFWIILISIFVTSCDKSGMEDVRSSIELPLLPSYFPEIQYPEDNEPTKARWLLGRKLFFDPIMSIDSMVSCATCHDPASAFTDGLSVSEGVNGRKGNRNSPSLSNVAYHPYFTREGGVPTLEMQILVPIQEHNEFDFNIVEISSRLNQNEDYVAMSLEAYGREPDHFVITRAIANYERSLISGRSLYDEYLFREDLSILSEDAVKGMDLFFSERLKCTSCHSGFDFTDYSFQNNGLYEQYSDVGRFRFTNVESDMSLFKTPSLRNVEQTGPYMHDGSIETLREVVDHYDSGGAGNPEKNPIIKRLDLSEDEKNQLISFLKTLTDNEFILNPIYYE